MSEVSDATLLETNVKYEKDHSPTQSIQPVGDVESKPDLLIDPKAEARLVRKFDVYIISILGVGPTCRAGLTLDPVLAFLPG